MLSTETSYIYEVGALFFILWGKVIKPLRIVSTEETYFENLRPLK